MKKKNTALKKIITGLIFLAALFFAAVVLVFSNGQKEYILAVAIVGAIMLLAAYLFLSAIFEEKAEEWSSLQEEDENAEDEFFGQIKGYMESVDRTQKAVFSVMKRREESTEEQISRLENAIERMAEQQMADHKELVKYNKENARQVAMNERETMEHVLSEVIKNLEEGRSKEIEALQAVLEKGTFSSTEDNALEEEIYEELAEEEFEEMPEFLISETEPVPEAPEEISTDALGAATGVDLSDPNAALTPEDIAKLFAAAGN